jgi:hypothetical protein
MLHSFANSTGLKVNYAKSMIIPINIDDQKLELLANTLGCAIGSMPFTYLGLPLEQQSQKLLIFFLWFQSVKGG